MDCPNIKWGNPFNSGLPVNHNFENNSLISVKFAISDDRDAKTKLGSVSYL